MGSSLQGRGAIANCKMKAQIIFIAAVIACTAAQDTFYCPDGWELFQREGKDGMDECSCYLFPTTLARVSHGDAQLLCSGHDAKLAEPLDGAPNNYWIVEQLQQPHYEDKWWMGGKSYTKHDTHNTGEWIWETSNQT